MCGICGFAGEDRGRIERMTKALVHRGPDGNAVYTGNGISLGHARLAILDPRPEGDQPMWNDDRTAVIVYNGEIFNFKELREKYGLRCKTGTDTEVLLKLYAMKGIDCVSELRGMFAFGLFVLRTSTWYLARDASGIKPLYWTTVGGTLAFASEMRSLMAGLAKKPALNMTSLSHYLRLQYVPGPETMCEGIESLPPGMILTWKDGKGTGTFVQSTCPPPVPAPFRSKHEFMERFPTIMDDSVRAHLVSDKPVGVFVSGGMDSSIVLHHMSAHAKKPLKSFTVRFDATEEEGARRFNTDADLARLTAAHYGTEHHEVTLTAQMCREIYKDTACALDQPNADSVAMAQVLLAREAKKTVDVVLCGAGGDELFGGYPRYRIARILQMLAWVPGGLRGAIGGAFGYPHDVLQMQPGPLLAERLLTRPRSECDAIVRGEWFDGEVTKKLFEERWAAPRNGCGWEEKNEFISKKTPQQQPFVAAAGTLRDFMEFDRHLWLVDESLRLADATTMSCGLECRVPFLDREVIAASHATPAEWHVTARRTKALLKDTYSPFVALAKEGRHLLPEHLFTLPKASFFPPLAKWIRRECAPLVEEALEHPRIREFFDTDHLHSLFDAHKKRETYALHLLSSITQLAAWFEMVYDE